MPMPVPKGKAENRLTLRMIRIPDTSHQKPRSVESGAMSPKNEDGARVRIRKG